MLVWLASYPRSGNHLLRTILARSFDLGSYEAYQLIARPIGPAVSSAVGALLFPDETLDAFLARARAASDLFLVKTHDLVPEGDRVIYVVRDGRAALASYRRYLAEVEDKRRSFRRLLSGKQWPGAWHAHVERFLARDPAATLVLRYEALASAHPPLEAIAAFLDVPLLRPFDVTFRELNQLDPKIFRAGSNAGGIETVERACSARFWRTCGATMDGLGYPRPAQPAGLASRLAGRLGWFLR
jgi:hypothetical protein